MKCEKCGLDHNLNQSDGSNAFFCKDCSENDDAKSFVTNKSKEIKLSTDDLLIKISKNVGIITFIIVFQFLLSIALAIYFLI